MNSKYNNVDCLRLNQVKDGICIFEVSNKSRSTERSVSLFESLSCMNAAFLKPGMTFTSIKRRNKPERIALTYKTYEQLKPFWLARKDDVFLSHNLD